MVGLAPEVIQFDSIILTKLFLCYIALKLRFPVIVGVYLWLTPGRSWRFYMKPEGLNFLSHLKFLVPNYIHSKTSEVNTLKIVLSILLKTTKILVSFIKLERVYYFCTWLCAHQKQSHILWSSFLKYSQPLLYVVFLSAILRICDLGLVAFLDLIL